MNSQYIKHCYQEALSFATTLPLEDMLKFISLIRDGKWEAAKNEYPAYTGSLLSKPPAFFESFSALPLRMALCEKCGNKRCPHATNNLFKCTNSNEPGQVGVLIGDVN